MNALLPGSCLVWGIKSSLRAYVAKIGGITELIPPAIMADNVFEFPPVSHDESRLHFSGGVTLTGHGGLVKIHVNEPVIFSGDSAYHLSTSVPNSPTKRIVVADLIQLPLEDEGATFTRRGFETRLTGPGAAWWGGAYEPGTLLDPVMLWRAHADASLPQA